MKENQETRTWDNERGLSSFSIQVYLAGLRDPRKYLHNCICMVANGQKDPRVIIVPNKHDGGGRDQTRYFTSFSSRMRNFCLHSALALPKTWLEGWPREQNPGLSKLLNFLHSILSIMQAPVHTGLKYGLLSHTKLHRIYFFDICILNSR